LKQALRDVPNSTYCLKLDVRKFYQSIDHDVLKAVLRKKVKCTKTLALLDEIIDSAPGIPIGNYISQWFGNVYLAYFDHFAKEKLQLKHYFRYCDDMVILSNDKQYLHAIFQQIKTYLNTQLKLEIKGNYQIFPVAVRGIDFLGYRFFHTHTLVRKSIVREFQRKIKSQKATPQTQSAYWGWFKHANTHNLISKYFMHKFNDFADEKHQLEGEKIGIDKVLNRQIAVIDFRVSKSKFAAESKGNYTTIQIEVDGIKKVLFTGSSVLLSQIEKYKEHLPFETTIQKINKYYTFS
jgi:hypothetical protein